MIGSLVEVEARLIYTGTISGNLSAEVRSGGMKGGAMENTTECLVVFVSVDAHGRRAGRHLHAQHAGRNGDGQTGEGASGYESGGGG